LQACGLTFGYSLEDFRQGLIEARDDGLILFQQVGRGKRANDVRKPTELGFEKAHEWLDQLPVSKKDFVALMRFMHQNKKQASKIFVEKKIKARKKNT
jgi:hypothetical protein